MATVTLSAGFDTENLWAFRQGAPTLKSLTTYEY